jgi:hypothetical protein
MDTVVLLGGVIGLVAMFVWIGALIWAAIQDGRAQDAVDRRRSRQSR